MIELSDDERAAVAEIDRTHTQRDHVAMTHAIFCAGLAAGIERGQKFLDDLMLEQGRAGEYGSTAECARLFRALLK